VIVGVTNEQDALVKKWIADKKPKYAIDEVAGDDADKAYGIKGFPHSYLVGADGNVIWSGHPGNLSEDAIEQALEKCSFVPAVPAQWKAINASITAKEYGKAWVAIGKELAKGENEPLAKTKDAIEKLAKEKADSADALAQSNDYAAAMGPLDESTRIFKGMPAADDAAKKLKEWRADKEIKVQLSAADDWKKAEALEKAGDPASRKKAAQSYGEIAKKAKGTPIGDRAQAAADRLKG